MDEATIGYWLTWVGTGAWGVCFWWMHRISSRQDKVLDELRDQAKRIEDINQQQHDILKEVHPNVDRIRQTVSHVTHELDTVADKVTHVEEVVADGNGAAAGTTGRSVAGAGRR